MLLQIINKANEADLNNLSPETEILMVDYFEIGSNIHKEIKYVDKGGLKDGIFERFARFKNECVFKFKSAV